MPHPSSEFRLGLLDSARYGADPVCEDPLQGRRRGRSWCGRLGCVRGEIPDVNPSRTSVGATALNAGNGTVWAGRCLASVPAALSRAARSRVGRYWFTPGHWICLLLSDPGDLLLQPASGIQDGLEGAKA
ncbi:hypothetical protein VTN00DRAFT_10347 [Thermoascus crustaceus]|uniref:uncharacterized protein n=1 Tax=Thermoascus crustaceus TaxID=5088 RepID=UPI0037434240